MNACHLRWNFCLTLQSCCQTCQSCRILASQSSLALPTCLQTCVLSLTAWRLTLLHSSPPTWSTRLGIGAFGVISGRRVLLPCWLNPCLTDKAYVIRSAKIGWQFWRWKRKSSVKSLPMPDMLRAFCVWLLRACLTWPLDSIFIETIMTIVFQTILLTMANSWLLFQIW